MRVASRRVAPRAARGARAARVDATRARDRARARTGDGRRGDEGARRRERARDGEFTGAEFSLNRSRARRTTDDGMPPKTTATGKKPAGKGTKKPAGVKKPAAKKKKAATKKKKAATKKKATAKAEAPKNDYELHGQKRDAPDETDPLRKFYASLRRQNPKSVMAEVWLMEHGLLEDAEAQADAYKRFLKSKGRAVPKLAVKKTTTVKKEPKSEVKTEAMSEEQVKPTVALDDDDSDSDVPLARRASLK